MFFFFCICTIQKKLYVEFIFDDNNDDDDDKLPGNNSDSHSLCTHVIYNEYIVYILLYDLLNVCIVYVPIYSTIERCLCTQASLKLTCFQVSIYMMLYKNCIKLSII